MGPKQKVRFKVRHPLVNDGAARLFKTYRMAIAHSESHVPPGDDPELYVTKQVWDPMVGSWVHPSAVSK